MGKTGTRLQGFCLNRIRPHVRVRSPPPIQSKPAVVTNLAEAQDDHKDENSGIGGGVAKPGLVIGRKVMIVVDSSIEAKGALQWALSHTVQVQDIVILLYVTKPSKPGEEVSCKEIDPKVYEFLQSMKTTCQLKRLEVQFEVATVEAGRVLDHH